ncbi:MAG: cation transporter [Eubacterium sp.]|nr:cation transporter [Eubacterium sp.]
MYKITVGIDGMMCGMCEAHMNEALRKLKGVKKVASSHKKGISEIEAEREISESEINAVVEPTGYKMTSYKCEPYEKKGLFGFLKKS